MLYYLERWRRLSSEAGCTWTFNHQRELYCCFLWLWRLESLWIEVFVPSISQIIEIKTTDSWGNGDKRKLHFILFFFLIKLQRIWGNKAFMKSLQHYIMRCQLTVLWHSVLCESRNTFKRCWRIHWPTGLTCRH